MRLLVDWAALQPAPRSPAERSSGRSTAARAASRRALATPGSRDELARSPRSSAPRAPRDATARSRARPVRHAGVGGRRAAAAASWPAREPFSRPLSASRRWPATASLIDSLLALGASEGVALTWWAPWNEPNDPRLPQPAARRLRGRRAAARAGRLRPARARRWPTSSPPPAERITCCSASSPRSPSTRRIARASQRSSRRCRSACCASSRRLVGPRLRRSGIRLAPRGRPVAALERALDARGECPAGARMWVTEAGAGAPHPGRARPAGDAERKRRMRGARRAARALDGRSARGGGLPVQLPRGPGLPGGPAERRPVDTSTRPTGCGSPTRGRAPRATSAGAAAALCA